MHCISFFIILFFLFVVVFDNTIAADAATTTTANVTASFVGLSAIFNYSLLGVIFMFRVSTRTGGNILRMWPTCLSIKVRTFTLAVIFFRSLSLVLFYWLSSWSTLFADGLAHRVCMLLLFFFIWSIQFEMSSEMVANCQKFGIVLTLFSVTTKLAFCWHIYSQHANLIDFRNLIREIQLERKRHLAVVLALVYAHLL